MVLNGVKPAKWVLKTNIRAIQPRSQVFSYPSLRVGERTWERGSVVLVLADLTRRFYSRICKF